jgi:hypothetical protein
MRHAVRDRIRPVAKGMHGDDEGKDNSCGEAKGVEAGDHESSESQAS